MESDGSDRKVKPKFFSTQAKWREWLEKHHTDCDELLVGLYKRDSGRPSMSWPESVDEALCFGWIDGVRRSVDEISYSIRFTPRRERSVWSSVNIKRAGELIALKLMKPAGLKAFEARRKNRSRVYSFEQKKVGLPPADERLFQSHREAWKFFCAQAPWYQRTATWWVISAKREETRSKRLATLISDSAAGRRIRELDRKPRA